MNDHLLHRLFGFICGSAGLVIAITGAMFWLNPPDFPIPGWGLAALIVGGLAVLISGAGVVVRQAWARWSTAGLAVVGVLAALAGIARALLDGNLAAGIIVLTAVMPLIMVISVMVELGRRPAENDNA